MFFEFGIKDFIDILLVAFLLYYTYKLMKASGSINVFTGILVFILIWLVVSQVLEMKLLGSIFDKLVSVGVLALIVLFQDEIRRFLLTLGSHQHASALVRFFTGNKKEGMEHDEIMPVVMACISMGKQKVGALIVVEHNMPLDDVVRTGEIINADINQRLIENIFFKNSPLHDGAMVISKKRIKAAQSGYSERIGFAASCGDGNISGVGCPCDHCIGRNRLYFGSLQRAVLSAPECRGIGESFDKRNLDAALVG